MKNMDSSKPVINGYLQHMNVKGLALALFVLVAMAISWFGALDDYAEDYVNETIAEAGIIYGVSRAINATISVAQTAQIDAVFVSVTVGEFLDPINDLVERFSEIMTIAITSLALQKILLLVAKDWIFNLLITVTGTLFLVSLFIERGQSMALKAFATLVLVRGSLLIILLANSTVDALFLESQISEGEQSIKALESEVSEIAEKAKKGTLATNQMKDINESIQQFEDDIDALTSLKENLVERIAELEEEIEDTEHEIETIRDGFTWFEWTKGGPLVDKAKDRITDLKEKKKGLKEEIVNKEQALDTVEDGIASKLEQLECADKQLKGEKCSFWEMPDMADIIPGNLGNTTDALKEKIGEVLSLMALVILRAILLPLLFWVLLYKTAKWIWRREFQFSLP